MKRIISFFVALLVFGSGTIVLGFLAGYPFAGVLIAVVVVGLVYLYGIYSQLSGAEQALRKPPPPGETQVTLKVFDIESWKSEKFIFSPPTSTPGGETNFHVSILSKDRGGRPRGSLKGGEKINNPDVMAWLAEAKRIWQEESYKDFVEYCEDAGQDEATVRSRINNYLP